jgi:hypothetical protein
MLEILIDTIQLEAGIGSPILEDTRTLDYLEWGWIPQIREFLHHVDGKIVGIGNTPPRYREGDVYIMDSDIINNCTYKEHMLIHHCRLHLQILEVLSDITNDKGDQIQNSSPPSQQRNGHSKPTPERKHGVFGESSYTGLLKTTMDTCGSRLAGGPQETNTEYITTILITAQVTSLIRMVIYGGDTPDR